MFTDISICQTSQIATQYQPKRQSDSLSIKAQTGYRRPHPQAICQDHNALLKVTRYSYNLNAPGFLSYHISRRGTGLPPDERAASFYLYHHKTKDQYAEEVSTVGKWGHEDMVGKIKTDKQLETEWLLVRLARAKLQDSWEIWKGIAKSAV